MNKLLLILTFLAMFMLGWSQPAPAPGPSKTTIQNQIIPQSPYVIPGYTGAVVTPATVHKNKMVQGQFLWTAPAEFTYSGTKTGTFVGGEVITQTNTGAKGIFNYDTGAGVSAGILIVQQTGTVQFDGTDQLTGGTSGATLTTPTMFEQATPYVWGPYKSNTGILAYNGQTTRRGAATNYPSYAFSNRLFATGSGIYGAQSSTKAVVTGTTTTGTPQPGEPCTQATSLATGRVLSVSGNVAIIEKSANSPADFDNSHTITFTTSTATLSGVNAVTNTSGVWWLEWSPDGLNVPFRPVLATNSSSIYLQHQICDCGIITKPITVASGTYSNTRVLWFGDYGDGGMKMYFNLPDKEPFVWHTMFTCKGTNGQFSFGAGGDQAIRHFHGAEFFAGYGANDGRLYIMCGDNDYQAGILYCDDVADMCNNPSNWGVNWGLTNVNGPARSSWFSSASIFQQTLTYSSESGPFRIGEKVTQGTNVGYVISDNNTDTMVINLNPGSSAFTSGSVVTGTTSTKTTTPTVAGSTSNIGGGLNYAIGNNPYPLTSTASLTGTQGMGGQDSRTVEIIGDGINTITATWTSSPTSNFIIGDIMRQATSGAWGRLVAMGVNTLYIRPDQSSVAFDNTHNITGSDAFLTTTSVTAVKPHWHAYFVPDQAARYTNVGTFPPNDGYAAPNGCNILRQIDINANTVTTQSGRVSGEGWHGCLMPNGTILIQSESDFNGGSWAGNSDAYVHLYAVTPDGSNLQEVQKWLRADYANPSGAVIFSSCFYAFGAVWMWDLNSNIIGGDAVLAFKDKPNVQYDQFSYNLITQPIFYGPNLIEDARLGRSETSNIWRASGSVGSAGVVPSSTITGLIPNYQTGMSSSGPNYIYKLNPSGSTGTCLTTYTLSVLDMYYLRGSFVTFSVWVYVPKASTNAPALQLQTGNGDVTQVLITPMDQWQRVSATIYLGGTEQSLLIQLFARTSTIATDTSFSAWTNMELIPGTQPSPSGTLAKEANFYTQETQRLTTSIAFTTSNVTATYLSSKYKSITFTGSGISVGLSWILPALSANQGSNLGWQWIITNSADQAITVKITGQSGVSIAAGKTAILKLNAAGTDIMRVTPDT